VLACEIRAEALQDSRSKFYLRDDIDAPRYVESGTLNFDVGLSFVGLLEHL
jgi:hypothetical protein